MKTNFIIIVVMLFFTNNIYAKGHGTNFPSGEVNKELRYESAILGYDVHYSIYLPPDYAVSGKRYPVLYLLHGFTGDNKSWVKQGEINKIMDDGIARGEIEPMIIVIPDGKYYWYIDDYQNKVRYEDFIFGEFLPFIDMTYRTIADKSHRAVAGLSMGGYGSLVWAMHHPDKFSYCIALSASMFDDNGMAQMPDQLYKYMSLLYGAPDAKGRDRVTEHFINNSPIDMARTNPAESLRSVKWFIDCGKQDQLSDVNRELNNIFTERNIDHIYHSRDGRHDWTFWHEGISQGLKYLTQWFGDK